MIAVSDYAKTLHVCTPSPMEHSEHVCAGQTPTCGHLKRPQDLARTCHTTPWGSLRRAWPYFLIRTAWIHGQHRPIGGLQRARALMYHPPAIEGPSGLTKLRGAACTPLRLALGLSPHPLLPRPHLQTMPRMSAFPGWSAVERLL